MISINTFSKISIQKEILFFCDAWCFSSLSLKAIFLKWKNIYIWQLQWSATHSKYKFCYLPLYHSLNVWKLNHSKKLFLWPHEIWVFKDVHSYECSLLWCFFDNVLVIFWSEKCVVLLNCMRRTLVNTKYPGVVEKQGHSWKWRKIYFVCRNKKFVIFIVANQEKPVPHISAVVVSTKCHFKQNMFFNRMHNQFQFKLYISIFIKGFPCDVTVSAYQPYSLTQFWWKKRVGGLLEEQVLRLEFI